MIAKIAVYSFITAFVFFLLSIPLYGYFGGILFSEIAKLAYVTSVVFGLFVLVTKISKDNDEK